MGRERFRARSAVVSVLFLSATAAACGGTGHPLAVPVASKGSLSTPSGSTPVPSGPDCVDGGPVTMTAGPKATPSAIIRSSDAVNTLGGAELLPTGFPVPPGFSVGQVGRIADVSITADILPGDVNAAYAYLLKALPAAGYRITGCSTSPAVAAIQFLGHECDGPDTEVVLSYATSTVLCEFAA